MSNEPVLSSKTGQSASATPLTLRGSPLFPEVAGGLPPSTLDAVDDAVATVRGRADSWTRMPVSERITLLERLIHDVSGVADRWVCSCVDAKGLVPGEAGARNG